ncbi:Uncharacterised protein [Achromobacter denitrificans]|nr:Uncharacterised protein [Achromobacter denitrificans]
MKFLLLRGVQRRADVDFLADQRDVALPRNDVAARDIEGVAGVDQHVAFDAADGAGAVEDLLAVERIRLLAGAIAETTHGPKARLLDHLVVVAVLGVLAGQDVDVAVGRHHQILLRANVRARHGQVASSHQHGGVAGEGSGQGLFPITGRLGMRGLRRQEAFGLVMRFVVGRAALHPSDQVDVAACANGQLLTGRDVSRTRVDVLPRDQRDVAISGNARTDFLAGTQVVPILLVAHQRFAVALFQRGQIDIPARLQTHVVLGGDLRRRHGQVATRLHAEIAGVHARHARDVRTPGRAVVFRRRCGCQRDVAARRQRDVVALDQRHKVGQVFARGQVDDGALDQTAGLVDDVGGRHDGGVARADGAAVVDVAVGRKLDVAAGHQGAVTLQVAFAHQQVHLRDQHGLGGAVGQCDGLFDQPHQVGGQLALLRFGQRRAKLDAIVQGELRAVGKQLLVLTVVVAKAFQEALAGSGQDLVGD